MKRIDEGTWVVHVGRRGVTGFRYPPMKDAPGKHSNVVDPTEKRLASHAIARLRPIIAGGKTARLPEGGSAPLFQWTDAGSSARFVAKKLGGRAVRIA